MLYDIQNFSNYAHAQVDRYRHQLHIGIFVYVLHVLCALYSVFAIVWGCLISMQLESLAYSDNCLLLPPGLKISTVSVGMKYVPTFTGRSTVQLYNSTILFKYFIILFDDAGTSWHISLRTGTRPILQVTETGNRLKFKSLASI